MGEFPESEVSSVYCISFSKSGGYSYLTLNILNSYLTLLDLGRWTTFDRYLLLPLLLQSFSFYFPLLDHLSRDWLFFVLDVRRRKRID